MSLLNLRQLQIFWAVAHSPSLTRAAKQLGLTQPSLSQQLAKLEGSLEGRLFDRIHNQLVLTDAGRYLLERAERILAEVDEAEAGLADFRLGRRGRIAVGALASLARCLLPAAWREALVELPDLEIDVHELAPGEALEQLYGRTLHMAVLSSFSLARNRVSFTRVDLTTDPYVLAVPRGLDLSAVADPEADLEAPDRRVLNRSIRFNFGNLHNHRIEEWYRHALPRHVTVATCRTYESSLAMVEAGHGVALVPLLAARLGGRPMFDVDLYPVPGMERPIVALVPPQYSRMQPYRCFLGALRRAAVALETPGLPPAPPFLLRDAAASSRRGQGDAARRP